MPHEVVPSACREGKLVTRSPFLADEFRRIHLRVVDIFEEVAVDLLGDGMDVNVLDLACRIALPVVPGQIHDGIGVGAAFLLVELFYLEDTARS